jgi:hypothetical protein
MSQRAAFGSFVSLMFIGFFVRAVTADEGGRREPNPVDTMTCPAGTVLWQWGEREASCATACTTDDSCGGGRCRVMLANGTVFADDIRDDILETQALMEEHRKRPIDAPTPCNPLDRDPEGCAYQAAQHIKIQPALPLMACEPVEVETA